MPIRVPTSLMVFGVAVALSPILGLQTYRLARARPWAGDSGGLDTATATNPCNTYFGFEAVGTVWDWKVSTLVMEGWERSELISLNQTTGEVQLHTTGEHNLIAVTYSYDRIEDWLCNEDGLLQVGWVSTWQLTNPEASVTESGTLSYLWDSPVRYLTAEPTPGDDWSFSGELVITDENGYESSENIAGAPVTIGSEEEIETAIGTLTALRVEQESGPTLWFARGYGVVKRSGMTLTDYTPGTP